MCAFSFNFPQSYCGCFNLSKILSLIGFPNLILYLFKVVFFFHASDIYLIHFLIPTCFLGIIMMRTSLMTIVSMLRSLSINVCHFLFRNARSHAASEAELHRQAVRRSQNCWLHSCNCAGRSE